jgi:hypothetical protein
MCGHKSLGHRVDQEKAMRELFTIFKALGLGAGLMYLLDPDSGAKRRSQLRRQALEVAVAAGDEADRLLVAAGHKLAEQGCQIREQIMHAVTGNGRHKDDIASATPEAAPAESLADVMSAASCPIANSRLLTGIGGSVLVAYGLRSRSPLALLATALGVGLVAKAILEETQELSPNEAARDEPSTTAPQDPATESRWRVAHP